MSKQKRGQTFLIAPMDHSVKLWNNSSWPSQALFLQSTFWPVSIKAEFDDLTTCLKMLL